MLLSLLHTFCKQPERIFEAHHKPVFLRHAGRQKNLLRKFFPIPAFSLLPFFQQFIDCFQCLFADFLTLIFFLHRPDVQAPYSVIHFIFRDSFVPSSFLCLRYKFFFFIMVPLCKTVWRTYNGSWFPCRIPFRFFPHFKKPGRPPRLYHIAFPWNQESLKRVQHQKLFTA